MGNRWIMLGVLAFAQLVLGLQCIGFAVSLPWMIGEFGLDRASAGQLVGLYLLPAVLFALPMVRRRRRLGNRPALLLGAGLMTVGGFTTAAAGSATALAVGQAIAGIGAAQLIVRLARVTREWFHDLESDRATAIHFAAWPAGAGLALAVLAPLVAGVGWRLGLTVAAFAAAQTFLLLAVFFHDAPPVRAAAAAAARAERQTKADMDCVFAVAAWLCHGAALLVFAAYAPVWSGAAEGRPIGLVAWLGVGMLAALFVNHTAGRLTWVGRHPGTLLALTLILWIAAALWFTATDETKTAAILVGFLAALPAHHAARQALPAIVDGITTERRDFTTALAATALAVAPALAGLLWAQATDGGVVRDFAVWLGVLALAATALRQLLRATASE